MRIWTIQPVNVYDKLMRYGILHYDVKESYYIQEALETKAKYGNSIWTFKDAYDWISNQMFNRVGKPPNGVIYPWWGWYRYKGKNKKPDLRTIGLGTPGEEAICIELEIPDREVLLSSHSEWHNVLNNCAIWYNKDLKKEDFEREYARFEAWKQQVGWKVAEEFKIKSWNKIFVGKDVAEDYVQCTFWELRAENVVKTQRFKCR